MKVLQAIRERGESIAGLSELIRFANYLGAHRVAQPELQERERALQRGLVPLCLSLIWAIKYLFRISIDADAWFIALCLIYGATSLVYRRFISFPRTWSTPLLYIFLLLDPLIVLGALVQDPLTFAFLNPFLLIMIVRSGLRYGVRTMYFSWLTTLLGSSILMTSAYWRSNLELTFAFILMLAFVPVFFASLIRKIHNVRVVEEDRARFIAVHELAVARNTFLAKVSHELRSPLQSIVSALDVIEMRKGAISPDDQELIGRMRRSSLLLNTQLRDLLTLARGEVGRIEMHPEPFEVLELVGSMADGARDLARAKGLELVIDLPAGPLFVVADGARIDQVLTNLVVNSIRYTDVGQVRVAALGHDPATGCLRFVVADTGPGIPDAVLPTLFAPDKVLTGVERRGEGSGIGLAIVRTLLHHLGGTIAVTSRDGRGTTFTLEIPAEPVAAADGADTEPGEPTGRVLVVDDREDILEALANIVEELGYECDRASSAAVGANLLAARAYDAVLLDIDMPVKSGDQLAAETQRGKGPNRETRFIGMSAAEASPDVRKNFHTCLAKPIDHAVLRRALIGVGHFSRPSQPGLWTEEA